MLRFRLFGHSVRVDWMFWVLCAFLGMGFLKQAGPDGLFGFLILTVCVFVSILWHELGHAWARKRYRAPYSEIVLHGMGGYCAGPGQFTRGQSMFISAAGPAASFLLGGAVYLLTFAPGIQSKWVHLFVSIMLFVNVVWAIMNLLPIIPLDGGRIFEAFMANKNPSIVPKVGFILALVIAILAVLRGSLWMAFLFGFMAYENWQYMQRFRVRRF